MRVLLALVAAVALLLGPATAAQAGASPCPAQASAPEKAMPAMAGMDQGAAATFADPCCDHKTPLGKGADNCAQSCAMAFGTALLPVQMEWGPADRSEIRQVGQPAAIWARLHDPGGLDRPPKPTV